MSAPTPDQWADATPHDPHQGNADCDYGPDDLFTCGTCGREVCFCVAEAESNLCAECWAAENPTRIAEMHGQVRFTFDDPPTGDDR